MKCLVLEVVGIQILQKKFAASSKNWMNPKIHPSHWRPPGLKPCMNPEQKLHWGGQLEGNGAG